jgi:hypothetical protein
METSVLGKLHLASRFSDAVNAPEDGLFLCANLTSLGNRNSENISQGVMKRQIHLFATRDVSGSSI